QMLRERADLMGVKYHPNIGIEKLKEKLAAKQGDKTPDDLDVDDQNKLLQQVAGRSPDDVETPAMVRMRLRKKALELVRIRITCMNPIKGNLKGVIPSVGNAQIGFVKKYIPFNAEQGWHVPRILLNQLMEKKYVSHYEVKVGNKKIKRHKLLPEYSIEILPPLTIEEIKDLAHRQLASQS
ncbi:MAG: hypothetical protein KAG92_10060, partial [Deltaproteobacteria bacterium]|nr:hypothetical protein [Deltaproteobacteria bacterium]